MIRRVDCGGRGLNSGALTSTFISHHGEKVSRLACASSLATGPTMKREREKKTNNQTHTVVAFAFKPPLGLHKTRPPSHGLTLCTLQMRQYF